MESGSSFSAESSIFCASGKSPSSPNIIHKNTPRTGSNRIAVPQANRFQESSTEIIHHIPRQVVMSQKMVMTVSPNLHMRLVISSCQDFNGLSYLDIVGRQVIDSLENFHLSSIFLCDLPECFSGSHSMHNPISVGLGRWSGGLRNCG